MLQLGFQEGRVPPLEMRALFCTRGHWGQLGSCTGPGQGPGWGSDSLVLLIYRATNKPPEYNFVISARKFVFIQKGCVFLQNCKISSAILLNLGQDRKGHNGFGVGC